MNDLFKQSVRFLLLFGDSPSRILQNLAQGLGEPNDLLTERVLRYWRCATFCHHGCEGRYELLDVSTTIRCSSRKTLLHYCAEDRTPITIDFLEKWYKKISGKVMLTFRICEGAVAATCSFERSPRQTWLDRISDGSCPSADLL